LFLKRSAKADKKKIDPKTLMLNLGTEVIVANLQVKIVFVVVKSDQHLPQLPLHLS
jgi:hypothetical protein